MTDKKRVSTKFTDTAQKEQIVSKLVPKAKFNSSDQKLDLIYKLLCERHELQQVCLEMLRGLEGTNRTPLIKSHWCSELGRVLYEKEIFLHCHRDLPGL